MPSFDYDAMHATAEKLIKKFGDTGAVTKKVTVTPDLNKPWERTVTPADKPIEMVVVPWSKNDEGRYFNQDIIRATSKALILWDEGALIEVDDEVTYDGRSWMVVASKPINPAGTGLIYVCALSGGA